MSEQLTQAQLTEKWLPILDGKNQDGSDMVGIEPIQDSYRRRVVAQLMETSLRETSKTLSRMNLSEDATTTTNAVDLFSPILVQMARRAFPLDIAFDLASVQALTTSSGQVFSLVPKYVDHADPAQRTDAFVGRPNTAWSGTGTDSGDAAQDVGVVLDSDNLVVGEVYEIKSLGTGTDFTTVGAPAGATVGTTFTATGTSAGGTTPGEVITLLDDAFSTGRAFDTAAGENLALGVDLNEMSFNVEKTSVEAGTRKLGATFTLELLEDLQNAHGENAQALLAEIVSGEMIMGKNYELMNIIKAKAKLGARNTTNPGVFDMLNDADARWGGERAIALFKQLNFEANAIAKDTRRGRGNFVITSSDVATELSLTRLLDASQATLQIDESGNLFAGTLNNGMKVFIDPFAVNDYVLVGYKGQGFNDAGVYYSPYIGMQMATLNDSDTGNPRMIFRARYAYSANPFAKGVSSQNQLGDNRGNPYFRLFRVVNLGKAPAQ